MNTSTCTICGKDHPTSEEIENYICEECSHECDECGKSLNDRNGYYYADGDIYCERCLHKNLSDEEWNNLCEEDYSNYYWSINE